MTDVPGLKERAQRSADPAAVEAVLGRLAERDPDGPARVAADPDVAAAFVAVAAASRWLGSVLARDPAALDVLATRTRTGSIEAVADGPELDRWRRLEVLRIAARDLTGQTDVTATMAALASMAGRILARAATLAGAGGLAVIAMGKTGGNELNYSSDVDVVLVGPTGDADDVAAARRLVEMVPATLRLDLDLRPEGRDGPVVRSLDGFEAHWERWAEPWERQALLKARAVAGDPDLGAAFEAAAAGQLWDRGFDAEAIHQVRALKARTERAALEADGDGDLKRTPGGLRDVEFTAQLLQLVHGPLDEALRVRGTLPALTALADGGYVDEADATWLAASYRFLRRIEHAVQLDHDRQVHAVPVDPADRARLARVLGLRDRPRTTAVGELDSELAACRLSVRAIHERIYFRPLLDAFTGVGAPLAADAATARLTAFGFADAARTQQAVAELTRGLTRSSRLMGRMLPLVLDWLSSAPDPDQGLLALRTLVAADPMAVAAAFRESPETARRVSILAGTSPSTVRALAREPQLLAEIGAPGVRRDDAGSTPSDPGPALRRVAARRRLLIAAADVLDEVPVERTGAALAAVARDAVVAAVAAADPQVPLAVMAVGRLAAGDLGYSSDLDLIVLHGADDEDGRTEAARATESLIRFLAGTGPADRAYDIDLDLRPGGRSAPPTRSVDSLVAHLERWAEPWERLALSRLRPLAGDPALAEGAMAATVPWLRRPLSESDRRAIRRVKARAEAERVPAGEDPQFHLKLGPGALSDVELTVDLLLLHHGLTEPATVPAIAALRAHGLLDEAEAEHLTEAHRFCARVRNRATLVAGRPRDSLPAGDDLTTLARSLDTTAPLLRDDFLRVTRHARRVVERRFYGREG